jgi:formamidopyrimidine-DNA glycosylase
MPELPEVEVTRLSFAAAIAGGRVCGVHLGKPLRWPLGVQPQVLVGQTVVGVRRRGKYLLLDLSAGLLLLHLGMSGSLAFGPAPGAPGVHDHFDLETSQGTLRLHDPRRFGAVVYASGEADPVARKLLGKLGPEPLGDDFSAEDFHAGLRRRSTSIYASEALFLAGIRPGTRASSISRPRALRLYQAIRSVLTQAVQAGGSTLRDFSNAQGQSGYFQLQAMVYGRAGEPCRECGTPVRQLRQGQRSSFFCPKCQKP